MQISNELKSDLRHLEGKNSMRYWAILALVFTGFAAATATAQSQDYPNRSLTMIVPFGAGGTTDIIARLFAQGLRDSFHESVIVENVGGAGGTIGTMRVAKATPDGYQFVLGNVGTHAVSQTFYKTLRYNAVTDFTPVILLVEQPAVLVVRKDLPVNNLQEFIAYVKANQASMQYGSAGAGSATHLACMLFNEAVGIKVTHVPYRGSPQAMQDLLAGRIDYQCPTATTVISQISAKTVKAIAVLSKNRSPSIPDLASAQEQGLANLDASSWYALFLPKGTAAPIVQKLHDAIAASMETSSMQKRLREVAADIVTPDRRSSEYLGIFVKSEIDKWAGPVKMSGAQVE
jgi:tripartite-type tricarboxylate transporter receptor subunit TctC